MPLRILFPSDGIRPLTFASPFINPSVKTDAHDNDTDKETLTNFASLGKKESCLVNNYFTYLFKSTVRLSSSEDH
jgi:hypothetical protein